MIDQQQPTELFCEYGLMWLHFSSIHYVSHFNLTQSQQFHKILK